MNKRSSMQLIITLFLLLSVFLLVAHAQMSVRVGDKVEYYCSCGGGQVHWQEARIEAVQGNKVRCATAMAGIRLIP